MAINPFVPFNGALSGVRFEIWNKVAQTQNLRESDEKYQALGQETGKVPQKAKGVDVRHQMRSPGRAWRTFLSRTLHRYYTWCVC